MHVGGTLTVDVAKGINADVKVKEGQLLEDALGVLGNTPGTEWLKNLQDRDDVQWDRVKDAYRSWDKKSESLNPVVGAVIAIAVAAVTAGSGLAAWAGSGAVGATGATGATASAVYGAAYGGMIGLTSQAAVALVENKGDLTQTLAALAKRDAVKSLVSSTIGTAINGGSFTDNLQTALLSNIGSQINAEGAKLIGDNGEILDVPGKAISHAAVSALAAEISVGDAKGAAVGALAAELAAITLDKTLDVGKYLIKLRRIEHEKCSMNLESKT